MYNLRLSTKNKEVLEELKNKLWESTRAWVIRRWIIELEFKYLNK